jgi:hypothetical protein
LKSLIKTTIEEFLNERVNSIKWIKPDLKTEEGEFTSHFLKWLKKISKVNFDNLSNEQFAHFWRELEITYKNAQMELLSDSDWSIMENTDSWDIHTEDELFKTLHGLGGREKQRIINHSVKPIQEGGIVETPIVAYTKNRPPYLVAGNTRLSVCRMLGITPMVTKIVIN